VIGAAAEIGWRCCRLNTSWWSADVAAVVEAVDYSA